MFKKLLMACLFLMHSLAFAGADIMIHVDDTGDGNVVVWRKDGIPLAYYPREVELRHFLQELRAWISANETLTPQSIVDFFKQEGYRLVVVNDNHPYYINSDNKDNAVIALSIGGVIFGGGIITGVLVLAGTISTGGTLPFILTAGGIVVMSIAAPVVDVYGHWSGPAMEEVMEAVHEALAGQEDVDWEFFVEQ